MKVIHGIVRLQTTPKKLRPKTKAAQSEARLKWLYTWSPSMPLLTPARRKGSPAPMLKEANYSQYLPHSGEARSCRGQACETFLQPAAAAHLPPCSLVLLFFGSILPQPLFLPLSSVSLWIALVSLFFSPAWRVFLRFIQLQAFILICTLWFWTNFASEEGNGFAREMNGCHNILFELILFFMYLSSFSCNKNKISYKRSNNWEIKRTERKICRFF